MQAALIIKRYTTGPMQGAIENWWVDDIQGHRWEIFAYDPPDFVIQYDTGENCGTGRFVLDAGQDLSYGSELSGTIYDTPVGEFGVPCQFEFESLPPDPQ
ncbi:MAG TPA: hypothetical protein VK463_20000 [Desulfomonilaceae bacterium]|nr:hypothetical protein [Desulfomonilaceae bacterium]